MSEVKCINIEGWPGQEQFYTGNFFRTAFRDYRGLLLMPFFYHLRLYDVRTSAFLLLKAKAGVAKNRKHSTKNF
jgi:hypothetical protein